jgi:hypothetical protein
MQGHTKHRLLSHSRRTRPLRQSIKGIFEIGASNTVHTCILFHKHTRKEVWYYTLKIDSQ